MALNEVQQHNYQKFLDKCKSHTVVEIKFEHYSVTEAGEKFLNHDVLYAINTEMRDSTPYVQLVHLDAFWNRDFRNGTLTPERMADELSHGNTSDRNVSLMHLMRDVFADSVVVTNPEFIKDLFAYTDADFDSLLTTKDFKDALDDRADGEHYAKIAKAWDDFYDWD